MFFYKIASANEALVITGSKSKESQFRILTGKGAFVSPLFSKTHHLSLDLREAQLREPCVTKQGIPLTVEAIAVFKVGDSEASISNAARRFLDQQNQMESLVGQILAGHLRSIIGGLTVEEIITDRNALAQNVRESSNAEMEKLGLIIDSFQIREITDPSKYIEQLAAPHIADVTKNARIAQAQADQAATEQEQIANAAKAGFVRDSQIAQSKALGESDAAKEQASQQGPLAAAEAAQAVAEQNANLAKKNAEVREAQLDAEVRRPADAAKYKAITEAEAEAAAATARSKSSDATRYQTVTAAEAERDAIKARAEGATAQAQQITTVAKAEADAIQMKNEALAGGNMERQVATRMVELMPEIVKGVASGLNGANLTILNGSEGLTDVITGVLSQGRAIYDTLVSGIKTEGQSPAPAPAQIPEAAGNGRR
jgi:flotillin